MERKGDEGRTRQSGKLKIGGGGRMGRRLAARLVGVANNYTPNLRII